MNIEALKKQIEDLRVGANDVVRTSRSNSTILWYEGYRSAMNAVLELIKSEEDGVATSFNVFKIACREAAHDAMDEAQATLKIKMLFTDYTCAEIDRLADEALDFVEEALGPTIKVIVKR